MNADEFLEALQAGKVHPIAVLGMAALGILLVEDAPVRTSCARCGIAFDAGGGARARLEAGKGILCPTCYKLVYPARGVRTNAAWRGKGSGGSPPFGPQTKRRR